MLHFEFKNRLCHPITIAPMLRVEFKKCVGFSGSQFIKVDQQHSDMCRHLQK